MESIKCPKCESDQITITTQKIAVMVGNPNQYTHIAAECKKCQTYFEVYQDNKVKGDN